MIWPISLALALGGVLAGHDLAYRLTGTEARELHAYLAHAPQLLLVLALPAALLAVSGTRGGTVRPAGFAFLGTVAYVAMEHLEQLAHGGMPWLLESPVFWLGLALQLPFALAAWWVARGLLRLEGTPAHPPRLPTAWLTLVLPAAPLAPVPIPAQLRLRGPPPLL
jgi:ABC-type dipeptide/oligopeptide/nickel transport system permease component